MNTNREKNILTNLRYDLPASIVVFLVAMPLCLGIALASGAPLFSGVIAGIVGGIVVGILSGSPLGVSGPAAGLAVIVLVSIQDLGAFNIFLLAVVIAGILQVILGFLKAGVIGYYFPSSVIKGMLSGIGIIIILKQIPHAFGYDADPEGDFSFFQVDGHTTFSQLSYMLDAISPAAIIIASVSMAILVLWEQDFMKKQSFSKLIQGPLVAVAAGIGLNIFFQSNGTFSLEGNQLVSIPVADSLTGFIAQFSLPDFSQWNNPQVYTVAITLAVVASLETLLCVEATDKLDPQKRVTPTNRELKAQGIGNIISGLIGGLPITQVIVRSSANIQSGGKSKMSALIHGLLLLVCVSAIPKILNLIPLASLAAILLLVGYKLAKPQLFKEMFKMGKTQFIPFVITIFGIVFTDLLTGIGLGLVVATIQILYNNYKVPFHFDPEKHVKGEEVVIRLSEDVSFLNKGSILRTLELLPDGSKVLIDGSDTKSVHPDILEIISDFKVKAIAKNINLTVEGLDPKSADNPIEQFGRVILNQPVAKRKSKFRPAIFNF